MESHNAMSDAELVAHAIEAAGNPYALAALIGDYKGSTIDQWRWKKLPMGMRQHLLLLLKTTLKCSCATDKARPRIPRAG